MIIARIEQDKGVLRPSEARVATYVLSRPSIAVESSIADLAAAAGVSEPTVIRFCRAIGCVGFQDFKRQLARDLERRRAAVQSTARPLGATISGSLLSRVEAMVTGAVAGVSPQDFEEVLALACAAGSLLVWPAPEFAADGAAFAVGLNAAGLDAVSAPPGPLVGSSVLVLAICGADGLAGWSPALRRAVEAGARIVAIVPAGAPASSENEVDVVLPVGGSGLIGRIGVCAVLEALRQAVIARLDPSVSESGELATGLLQASREEAWAAARAAARAAQSA